jgi:hypothetical protein
VGLDANADLGTYGLSGAYPVSAHTVCSLAWMGFRAASLYHEDLVICSIARDLFPKWTEQTQWDSRPRRLCLGISLKAMRWDTGPTRGPDGDILEDLTGPWVFGLDLGVLYKASGVLSVGSLIQDLNTPNLASNTSEIAERKPISLRCGAAYTGAMFTWALDFVFTRGRIDLNTGLESQVENVGLRVGLMLVDLVRGTVPTLGVSFKPGGSGGWLGSSQAEIELDYGVAFPLETLASSFGTHSVSTSVSF